jgi:hypothetical protein
MDTPPGTPEELYEIAVKHMREKVWPELLKIHRENGLPDPSPEELAKLEQQIKANLFSPEMAERLAANKKEFEQNRAAGAILKLKPTDDKK